MKVLDPIVPTVEDASPAVVPEQPKSPTTSTGRHVEKLLIVLPFYSGDASACSSNLLWMKELDGKLPYECLLAADDQTDMTPPARFAAQIFAKVHKLQYPRLKEEHWPWPQNNSFMQTAWHVKLHFNRPWLWVETDSIPTRKGWIDLIWQEYQRGKKPFGGHLNTETQVFNGVGLYPASVPDYSVKAMTAALIRGPQNKQPPWDVYASRQILPHLHVMNGLFQHVWTLDGKSDGQQPTFPDTASVSKLVRPGVALYHRNKDQTLIKRMREHLRNGKEPCAISPSA